MRLDHITEAVWTSVRGHQARENAQGYRVTLAVSVLLRSTNSPGFAPANGLPDDHRELEPPDPIPNSEVKRLIADGSVGFPHVRVGHRQALI